MLNFSAIKINGSQNLNEEGSRSPCFVSLCQPSTKAQVTVSLEEAEVKAFAMPALQRPFAQTGFACECLREDTSPWRGGKHGSFPSSHLSKFQEIVGTWLAGQKR